MYLAQLYIVTKEEWIEKTLTIKYTGEFYDYVIVKHDKDLVFSSRYKDVITNREYKTSMDFKGQIYVNSKTLISLYNYVENEKLTKKGLQDLLNHIKLSAKTKESKANKKLEMLGLVLSKLVVELGEEKASMILNQIIEEIGIEKTEEITNPLSELLGYNVVEKAKNIERTRKK